MTPTVPPVRPPAGGTRGLIAKVSGPSGGHEREAKLSAWPGFALPELAGVIEGVAAVVRDPLHLDATYYDTVDLRLARWGVTVRYRSSSAAGRSPSVGPGPVPAEQVGRWTLKLPVAKRGSVLVRRELDFTGRPSAVPAGVVDLVRGYSRRSNLVAVARLKTRRSRVDLLDRDGRRLAEVVDDEVSVYEGRRLSTRFREVEVEMAGADSDPLGDGATGLLPAVVAALTNAGAGADDPVPKLVRALGARARQPPDLVATPLDSDASLGDVVGRAITAGVMAMVSNHAGVLLGEDAERVHQARVATRRLRSDLHTFGSLVDVEWKDLVRSELRWLGALLGAVRDTDVLTERLQRQAATLAPTDAARARPLFARLATSRESARSALVEAMAGDRYVALLDQLVAAASAPPLLSGADRLARDNAAELVRRPWKALSEGAGILGADSADQELHDLRIRAKRCRYAVEAVSEVVGKPAIRFAREVAGLQSVLGDHQDAVIAEAWLREALAAGAITDAAGDTVGTAMAVGQLVLVQRIEAAERRAQWSGAWDRARRKSLRKWIA